MEATRCRTKTRHILKNPLFFFLKLLIKRYHFDSTYSIKSHVLEKCNLKTSHPLLHHKIKKVRHHRWDIVYQWPAQFQQIKPPEKYAPEKNPGNEAIRKRKLPGKNPPKKIPRNIQAHWYNILLRLCNIRVNGNETRKRLFQKLEYTWKQ